MKIAFLHHSTGQRGLARHHVQGERPRSSARAPWAAGSTDYNKKNGTSYEIEEMNFPNDERGLPLGQLPV